MAPRNLVLAVDGGQTSSKAIIATTSGEILGWGTGSACDHLHGPNGYERNRDAIHTSARAALIDANVTERRIVAVGLGLTSAPRESEALPLFSEMVHTFCDPEVIWVDADFVANLAGASALGPGVVVIAGGGSIGYGVDEKGGEAIAGGLGYLMGDEGSGWYIGLRAIQEAAKAADRRGPDTALLPMVLDHYGIASIREIIRILYATTFRREKVAALTPSVVAIAKGGDTVARSIVDMAAVRLGEIALGTLRQLFSSNDAVAIFPTGGVFGAGPLVMEPFTSTISSSWSTAVVREPRFPPVVGGLLKALEKSGMPITDDVLRNLDRSVQARNKSR